MAMTAPAYRSTARRELRLLGILGILSFFIVWMTIAESGLVSRQFVPSPVDVVKTFFRLTQEPFAGGTLQAHLVSSVGRYLGGFGLAALVGIPLGLAMGWFRWLDDIVSPIFDGLRFIAPVAWVPFAALWFGTGIGGPIMIIFSGAFPPCVINAYRGARFVDKTLIEAGQMLGAGNFRMIREILLPASVPSILAGLRVSAGLGWQSLVGAELIVVSTGIGYMMVQGQSNVSTSTVMAGMVAIGLIGVCIDFGVRALEAHINRVRGR
jgi:NitT/TauT family transport system permease protein